MNTVLSILCNPNSNEFRSFFGFETDKADKTLSLYTAFLVFVIAPDGAILKAVYSTIVAIVLWVLIVYDRAIFSIGCVDHTLGKEAQAFCSFDWFLHGPNQIVVLVAVYFTISAGVTYYYFKHSRYLAPGSHISPVLSLLWTLHVLVLSLTPVMAFVYFKVEDGVHVFLPTKIFCLVAVVIYGFMSLIPVFPLNGFFPPLVIVGHFAFGVVPLSFYHGKYLYRPNETFKDEMDLLLKAGIDFILTACFAFGMSCVWSLWFTGLQSIINLWVDKGPVQGEEEEVDKEETEGV
jgi:hypothetical protein